MARAEDMWWPRVNSDNLRSDLAHEWQTRSRRGSGSSGIEIAHARVVGRRDRKTLGDRRAEGLESCGRHSRDVVVLSLEPECGPTGTRHVRCARAASPVRREDGNVVCKREHTLAQRLVGGARELRGLLRTQKVDAGDVADEQGSAREEVLRIVG